jgi:hypothetical protein
LVFFRTFPLTSWRRLRNAASSANCLSIPASTLLTALWERKWNLAPISMSLSPQSVRARYIATARGSLNHQRRDRLNRDSSTR